MIMNYLNKEPKLVHINRDLALGFSKRFYNWERLYVEKNIEG